MGNDQLILVFQNIVAISYIRRALYKHETFGKNKTINVDDLLPAIKERQGTLLVLRLHGACVRYVALLQLHYRHLYSSVQYSSVQYSSTRTVQQYTYSTAVHVQYSSTRTVEQYTYSGTRKVQ